MHHMHTKQTGYRAKVAQLEVAIELFNGAQDGRLACGSNGDVVDVDGNNNLHIVLELNIYAGVRNDTCKANGHENLIEMLVPEVHTLTKAIHALVQFANNRAIPREFDGPGWQLL